MELRKQWNQLTQELSTDERYWHLTATNIGMRKIIDNMIPRLNPGVTLDIGAGWLAFKKILTSRFDIQYYSCDVVPTQSLDFIADAFHLPVGNGTLSNAICSAVMEHVGEPQILLDEIANSLSPGGILLITAPHFHYIHAEPNDFFRFTRYGLKYILEHAGFQVLEIQPVGGLVSFLSTLISTVFLSFFGSVHVLRPIALALNRLFVHLSFAIDSRMDKDKIFALGYIAIAIRKEEPVL
jgi:SAM-dependent methyltransferase